MIATTTLDKAIRRSLCTVPREYGAADFYPALSTYRVARPFGAEELGRAVRPYFAANPLFQRCELQERVLDAPESLPLADFQALLVDEYRRYCDGFLLMSVRYRSDPTLQGIFTCFPMPMMDGFKCFLFHQALMRSLKSGRDEFRMREAAARHGLRLGDLERYVPRARRALLPGEDVRRIPRTMVETAGPARGTIPLLTAVRDTMAASGCRSLLTLKNASHGAADDLLFGNLLLFPVLPEEKVLRSSGEQIRRQLREEEARCQARLESLREYEHFVRAGQELAPSLAAWPDIYGLNNYGDCTAHSGIDLAPERGRLIRYQWHMPASIVSLFKGARWTLTLAGEAQTFTVDDVVPEVP